MRRAEKLAEFFWGGGGVYVAPQGIATVGWWEIWTQNRDDHPSYLFAHGGPYTAYGDSVYSSQMALNAWYEEQMRQFSFLNFLHVLTIPDGWHLVDGFLSANVWYAVISDDPADPVFRPSWVSGDGSGSSNSPPGNGHRTTYEPTDCRGDAGVRVQGGYIPPYSVGFVTWEGLWEGRPAFQYQPTDRNESRQPRRHGFGTSYFARVAVVPDPETGFDPVLVSISKCSGARVWFDSTPDLFGESPTSPGGGERLRNARPLRARGLAGAGETRMRKITAAGTGGGEGGQVALAEVDGK